MTTHTSSEFLLTVSTAESSCSHGDIFATTSVLQSDTIKQSSHHLIINYYNNNELPVLVLFIIINLLIIE